MHKFIASTSTIVRTLQVLYPEQPTLAETMRHTLSLTKRKGEVLCFDNGAKLRRLGSHLWGVDGYTPETGDEAASRFADALRRANMPTTAERLVELCYETGDYARPRDAFIEDMGGRLITSSNDGNQSGWSYSPTDVWEFEDGSRAIVSYSYADLDPGV